LTSHKHKKSFISAIQHSNRALTTSIDEVGAEFVYFLSKPSWHFIVYLST
jgi:hypothetical protein